MVPKRLKTKTKALFLILVAFYSFLVIPTAPLWAQAPKISEGRDLAPVIRHEPPTRAFRSGESVTIQATVTSKRPITEVTLFWRVIGEEKYSSINMERLQQKQDIYSAVIPGIDIMDPGIEYYIQVSDESGNVALRGLSFSPLTIMVTAAPPEEKTEEAVGEKVLPTEKKEAAQAEGKKAEGNFTEKIFPEQERQPAIKTETVPEKPWYKKWWVWTIMGAVVIGVAAAAGGGGGGKDSGPETAPVSVSGSAP